jgi:hypothetical protein
MTEQPRRCWCMDFNNEPEELVIELPICYCEKHDWPCEYGSRDDFCSCKVHDFNCDYEKSLKMYKLKDLLKEMKEEMGSEALKEIEDFINSLKEEE